MSRRELMRTAVAAIPFAGLPGCGAWLVRRGRSGADRTSASGIRVDPHCHIFNANDLPIAGFVRDVLLRERGYRPAVIHQAVDFLLQAGTPGFRAENEMLDELLQGRRSAERAADIEPTQPEFEEFLRGIERRDPREVDRVLAAERGVAGRRLSREDRMAEAERTTLWGVFRWAHLLRQYRYRIADKLIATYSDVDLFTPSMVDLDYGVHDRVRASVPEQIVLYEKIVRLNGGKVHPFVPFDPIREAQHGENGDHPSLYWARLAVRERGFVGVKLYPPIGFLPIGNPAPVDRALEAFYDWAVEDDVPIMAHCNDSNAAGQGFGGNASPEHWAKVLRRWPSLRLSLGHLGGVENFLDHNHESWAWAIGGLMREFPNVYADVAYHRVAFDDGEAIRERYFKGLQELEQTFPPSADRILYGSDWEMILIETGADHYATVYRDLYGRVFGDDATAKFVGSNAMHYLGLDGGTAGQQRARLLAFYSRHGMTPPAWLET